MTTQVAMRTSPRTSFVSIDCCARRDHSIRPLDEFRDRRTLRDNGQRIWRFTQRGAAMKWSRPVMVLLLLVVGSPLLQAQLQDMPEVPANLPEKNPLAGDQAAILAGMSQFRARCADCHGIDARGARGPDITEVWASGRTDNGLFRTIRLGVPGTEMPPIRGDRPTDNDIWRILAYLRTLATPVPVDLPKGNAQNGERLFRVHCVSCHRADGRGGRLGPDLSRVGLSRARSTLTRQIRGAVEEFGRGYEP